RLREVAQGADLGPGERPPGGHRLPPGEPLPPARPQAPLGWGEGGDRRRFRGGTPAVAAVPGPLGRRAEGIGGGVVPVAPTRRESLAATALLGAAPHGSAAVPPDGERSALGIVIHSFGQRLAADAAKPKAERVDDPLVFLDYCRGLGAGGIQLDL